MPFPGVPNHFSLSQWYSRSAQGVALPGSSQFKRLLWHWAADRRKTWPTCAQRPWMSPLCLRWLPEQPGSPWPCCAPLQHSAQTIVTRSKVAKRSGLVIMRRTASLQPLRGHL